MIFKEFLFRFSADALLTEDGNVHTGVCIDT